MDIFSRTAIEGASRGPGAECGEKRTVARRSFLGRGAAAVAAGAATFAGRSAKASNPNYLPSLYPNENVTEFHQIQADENNHVAKLVQLLGASARPKPTFKNITQATLVAFAQTARALENTGTGAYLGAAPYIYSHSYLVLAAQILPIEARHASYLDVLLNENLLTNALGQGTERRARSAAHPGGSGLASLAVHRQPQRRSAPGLFDDPLAGQRHRDLELCAGSRIPRVDVLQHQPAELHLMTAQWPGAGRPDTRASSPRHATQRPASPADQSAQSQSFNENFNS